MKVLHRGFEWNMTWVEPPQRLSRCYSSRVSRIHDGNEISMMVTEEATVLLCKPLSRSFQLITEHWSQSNNYNVLDRRVKSPVVGCLRCPKTCCCTSPGCPALVPEEACPLVKAFVSKKHLKAPNLNDGTCIKLLDRFQCFNWLIWIDLDRASVSFLIPFLEFLIL